LLDLPFQGPVSSFYDARLWLDDASLNAVFPDCVETSTRQIASVPFLEPSADGWRFDIGAIRVTAARPDLGDFFAGTERAELAGRDSDADFTSKWSRVIAGLEGGDGVPSPVYISPAPDGRLENEARAALISRVRLFAALFGLQSEICLMETVEGVAAEFGRLLGSVNPKRKCTVTVVDSWEVMVARPSHPAPQREFGGHF
jgi:hypothetical protein